MMTLVELALIFLAGLGGSLHCLGMCGVFAVGAARKGSGPFGHALPYTLGRLVAYSTLGLTAGFIGRPLVALAPMVGAEGGLAVAFGVVMVLGGLHLLGIIRLPAPRLGTQPAGLLARILQATLPPAGPAQAVYLGVGNGLLPCPLIYGFLPLAMSTGSGTTGALVMAIFGLGTSPALLVLAGLSRDWFRSGRSLGRHSLMRFAPGVALVAFGLFTAGRAALPLATHAGHTHM